MNRHGSINIHERINLWRQDGWKGFNAAAESVENEDPAKSLPVLVPAPTTDTTIPVTPLPNAMTAEPALLVVEKEPIPSTTTQPNEFQDIESATA